MTAVWIVLRIVLFLAVVGPLVAWIVRRAREANGIPTDRAVDHHTERARGESEAVRGGAHPGW